MSFLRLKRIVLLLIMFETFCVAAQTSEKESVLEFQRNINKEFKDPAESPLTIEERKVFKSLPFLKIDTTYVVEAEFVRTPFESPFEMPTTKERTPIYVKYGELYFKLKGKNFKLNVYQSQDLLRKPEYADYLFLPFTDLTNGDITYGGGRYIDLLLPLSKKVTLDFNKAYNPYCAYSKKYACPIPPVENDLDIAIPVGVSYNAEDILH